MAGGNDARFDGNLRRVVAGVMAVLCAAPAVAAAASPPRPWEQVRITPVRAAGRDSRQVAARVLDAGGSPVNGASVSFTRGEHLVCDARTAADGRPACRLFDAHGHAEHERDDGATVVTFAGVVAQDKVLLPRTHVVPGSSARRHGH